MIRRLTIIIISLLGFAAAVFGDEGQSLRNNKEELDRIKRQLTETRQKVDSLNQLEAELEKAVSGYSESVSRNRKVINKTERQLGDVRKQLATNNERLETTENRLKTKRENYLNLLADFYRRRRSSSGFEKWDLADVMSQSRMVHYLASISGRSTQEIAQVGDSVQLLSRHVDSLTRTDSDLDRLRREKKAKVKLDLTLKEKEETSLSNVRRQSNMMQERLETLSEAARRMEEIIAELEREQERRRLEEGERPRFRAGQFAQLKGRLRPPIKGKIISTFGWKKDKITNLSSFSPGIDIRPLTGHTDVRACAPGRVAYVGRLRGYDNFVIIEHDDGFYTTYAGLGQASVELDDLIDAGNRVGTLAGNTVHFEIRQGREHLDPVIWLDINEF